MKNLTISLLTLFCVSIFAQETGTKLTSVDLLNSDGKAEGSFDKGWRQRLFVHGGKDNKATSKILTADDKTSTGDGKKYLKIDITGGDVERLNASASLRNIPVDLAKGRRFRVEWQTHTQNENDLQGGNSALLFFADNDARVPLKVMTSKSDSLERGAWKSHSAEFVYDEEADSKRLDLKFGFWRWIPNGRVINGSVLIDGIKLWQIDDPDVKVGKTEALAAAKASPPPVAPIPVIFTVPKDGKVTLVMEDKGKRIANLIEGVFFKKGTHTYDWDGLDVGDNKYKPGGQAYYTLNQKIVEAGTYKIRGLVHDPLKLTYDFTAYPNIGKQNVPWPTHLHDGDGGWLADHGVPHAAAFIPAKDSPYGEDVVALAATVSEAGPAMAYVNMAGKKLGGLWRLGGDWTGAYHFTTDSGAERNPAIFVYSIMSWQPSRKASKNSVLIKILGLSKQGSFEVDYLNLMLPEGKTWQDNKLGGYAVHDGLLVFSELTSKSLYLYDTSKVNAENKGTLIKRIEMPNVQALAFAPDGALLMLVDKTLEKFTIDRKNYTLVEKKVLIKDGLDDPQQLMVAADGRIFIADWGKSNQVKIYSPKGKPVATLGSAGPISSGLYVATHMNNPFGMTLDSKGRLWVAERSRLPKRVSLWDVKTGKLDNAFYGPTQYGGGGVLDPKDSSILYYANGHGCMSIKLDRKKGEGMVERIVYRNDEVEACGGKARYVNGHFPVYNGKKRYITNAYTGPTSGSNVAEFWLDGAGAAQLKTMIGGLRGFRYFSKNQARLGEYFPIFTDKEKPKNVREQRMLDIDRNTLLSKTLACWIDSSNDGKIDSDEIKFLSFVDSDDIGRILSANIGEDFEILIVHEKGVISIPSNGFSAEGHPLYDLGKIEYPITGIKLRGSSGGNQAMRCEDDSIIITGGPMQNFAENKQTWKIHSQWPSLHAGHAAPPSSEYPGQMVSTTRLLGPLVKPTSGDAGQIWCINSDKGVMYLVTSDGYYLATLGKFGGDSKQWVMNDYTRGMDVADINHLSENFYPTINQNPDGSITLISGKTHISLLNLSGLESVKRFEAKDFIVDANVIEKAKIYGRDFAVWQRAGEGNSELDVERISSEIKIDGNLEEWKNSKWVTISKVTEQHGWGRPVKVPESDTAWAIDDTNLYIAVRSQQKSFIENSGKDPLTFFSTGGGVDIRLAAKDGSEREDSAPKVGDLRLVVARHDGKTTAFLYQAKVLGTKESIRFSSPVSSILIDKIDDVSDKVTFETSSMYLSSTINPKKKNHFTTAEFSIPLKTLGWDPKSLPETTGDIGLLIGEEGRTTERSYWHNKGAGIVSDLPSEASLDVSEWGKIKIAD